MSSRGEVLREVMLETGTTQSELSRIGGVRQPSISQYLSGQGHLSDDMLDRLLSCIGYRLEVVRRPVKQELGRFPPTLLATAPPALDVPDATDVERVAPDHTAKSATTARGCPWAARLRNLDRWQVLIEEGDLSGLRRAMTGLDTDSSQMREVSPMAGLLPQEERAEILQQSSL
jgi:transcriptional regulator with XRE-family HTH domain